MARYANTDDGHAAFVANPPLIIHLDNTGHDLEEVDHMLHDYRATLPDDRRLLLDPYRIVGVAHCVGGSEASGRDAGSRSWKPPTTPRGTASCSR